MNFDVYNESDLRRLIANRASADVKPGDVIFIHKNIRLTADLVINSAVRLYLTGIATKIDTNGHSIYCKEKIYLGNLASLYS